MPSVTLKAHYDGETIRLDEPFEIPPHSPLLVTVLAAADSDVGADWLAAARTALAQAYGPDEPEYTDRDLTDPSAR